LIVLPSQVAEVAVSEQVDTPVQLTTTPGQFGQTLLIAEQEVLRVGFGVPSTLARSLQAAARGAKAFDWALAEAKE
jgi:hypothetical protein